MLTLVVLIISYVSSFYPFVFSRCWYHSKCSYFHLWSTGLLSSSSFFVVWIFLKEVEYQYDAKFKFVKKVNHQFKFWLSWLLIWEYVVLFSTSYVLLISLLNYWLLFLSSISDEIVLNEVTVTYRVLGYLLLGVVRIYSKKVEYLFDDCKAVLVKINMYAKDKLHKEAMCAPYNSITLPDTFELDAFDLEIVEDVSR